MKHHIHKRFAAIALLAVLGWGRAAWADTKVRASSFEYDASGLLTKEVIEPDSPSDCLQTSYSYDTSATKPASDVSLRRRYRLRDCQRRGAAHGHQQLWLRWSFPAHYQQRPGPERDQGL